MRILRYRDILGEEYLPKKFLVAERIYKMHNYIVPTAWNTLQKLYDMLLFNNILFNAQKYNEETSHYNEKCYRIIYLNYFHIETSMI